RQLRAGPAHRTRREVQIGDVTAGVDLDPDTVHLTKSPNGCDRSSQLPTMAADFGELPLELLLPFLNIHNQRPTSTARLGAPAITLREMTIPAILVSCRIVLDYPPATKLGPKTIRKIPAVCPKVTFIGHS